MTDLKAYLKQLNEKQERIRLLKESREPQVGIIYYIKGALLIEGTPISEAESVGDYVNEPLTHDKYWSILVKKVYPELRHLEYFYYPRGRVVYNKKSKEFYIYLDKLLINRVNLVKRIKEELNLVGQKVKINADPHYKSREVEK